MSKYPKCTSCGSDSVVFMDRQTITKPNGSWLVASSWSCNVCEVWFSVPESMGTIGNDPGFGGLEDDPPDDCKFHKG